MQCLHHLVPILEQNRSTSSQARKLNFDDDDDGGLADLFQVQNKMLNQVKIATDTSSDKPKIEMHDN